MKAQQYAPTAAAVRHVGCGGACVQGRWPQLCDCKPMSLPVRPMPQKGYVCDDTGWPLTVQASTSSLHDTGFGPIAAYGDEPQRDVGTWAMLAGLMALWALLMYVVFAIIWR